MSASRRIKTLLQALSKPNHVLVSSVHATKCVIADTSGIAAEQCSKDEREAMMAAGYIRLFKEPKPDMIQHIITEKGRKTALKPRHVRGERRFSGSTSRSPFELLVENSRMKQYFTADQIQAGNMFKEDFMRAQNDDGYPTTMNWNTVGAFVDTGFKGTQGVVPSGWYKQECASRLEQAIQYLGVGLSDVVLLHICYERGLEETEQTLGWSARSAKVVLRIALQHLTRFYGKDATSPMIGE